MIGFTVVSAMLVAGALLFVVPPLVSRRAPEGSGVDGATASALVLREQLSELDRDLAAGRIGEARHASARREIERRVLEDAVPAPGALDAAGRSPRLAVSIALAVPVFAAALYWQLGSPSGLEPSLVRAAASGEHALTRERVQTMVESLAQRLASRPDDADGWIMLARSRIALGQYGPGADAFARAVALRPDDAGLLADFADTLAMSRGRRLAGEPAAIVERALGIDPGHPKALALAGTAAFERGDYRQAIARWQRLLEVTPDDPDTARSVRNSIEDARRRAGPSAPAAAAAGGPQAGIEVLVDIAPELAAAIQPTDTLFVVARVPGGGPMPIAAIRRPVGSWPLAVRLDDSASLDARQTLSAAPRIVLTARVSKSGAAAARAGDIEGHSEVVSPDTRSVRISLSTRLP